VSWFGFSEGYAVCAGQALFMAAGGGKVPATTSWAALNLEAHIRACKAANKLGFADLGALARWNDERVRTHASVLVRFDAAIRVLSSQGAHTHAV
jgi:hypothetical protein